MQTLKLARRKPAPTRLVASMWSGFATAVAATLAASLPASAATWVGGDGIWSTTVPNWDGGIEWVQGSSAIFGGAAGDVELGEAITASSLSLNSNDYLIDLSGFDLSVAGATGGSAGNLASTVISNTSATTATFSTGSFSSNSGPILSGNMNITHTGSTWTPSSTHNFTGTLSLLGTGLIRTDDADIGINSSSALTRLGGSASLQLGSSSGERVYERRIEITTTGGFTTNGSQAVILAGEISGTGNFNRTGGQGMVILAGNNTFTGKITVPSGGSVIVAASANAFGAANADPLLNVVEGGGNSNTIGFMGNADVAGTKRITTGGGLRSDGMGNLHNFSGINSFAGDIAIANNQAFMVEPGSQLTLTGIFSGGRALNKHGGGTLVLANQMTITNGGSNGAFRELLNVFDGTVLLDFDQPSSPNFGIINAALSTTAALPAFSGGTLELKGQAGEANSDFFDDGLLVNIGASEFKITKNGALSVGARLGSMGARSAGGTINFTLPDGAQSLYTGPQTGNGFTTTKVNTNGIIGGYATVDRNNWAMTGNGTGTRNITAYSHSVAEQDAAAFDTATHNVDITAANTAATVSNKTVNSLRFTSGGALVLDGTNVLTSGGILVTGSTAGAISGGTLQGGASADLIVIQNSTAEFSIASKISDNTSSTGLTKSGPGTLTVTGANDYTGPTFVLGGVLKLGSAAALPGGIGATGGTSKLVLKGGVVGLTSDFSRTLGSGFAASADKVQWFGSGGFAAYGGTRAVNLGGTATWHGTSGYDSGNVVQTAGGYAGGFVPYGAKLLFGAEDADGTVDFQSNINLGNNNVPLTRIIEVADSPSASVEARISGVLSGSGFAGLNKTGAGTLELAAINTYNGRTIIAEGELRVTGSISGASPVSILDAGTLSGIGTVGAVSIQAGGTIAPGLSTGILNTGNLTFSGGTFTAELDTLAFDQLNVTGTVAMAAPSTLTLSLSTTFSEGTEFTLIANNGTDAITFADSLARFVHGGNSLDEGEIFGVTGGFGFQSFQISYAGGTGNDVVLTAIPEPGAVALMLGGFSLLFGLQRHRFSRRATK